MLPRHEHEPWHWAQRHPAWWRAQPPTLQIGSYLPYTTPRRHFETFVERCLPSQTWQDHGSQKRSSDPASCGRLSPQARPSLYIRIRLELLRGWEQLTPAQNTCLGLRNGKELLVEVPIPFERPESRKRLSTYRQTATFIATSMRRTLRDLYIRRLAVMGT